MAKLFEIKRAVSSDDLKDLRKQFVSAEYCEECYDKHKNKLPLDYSTAMGFGKETLHEYLHASAYYGWVNRTKMAGNNEISSAPLSTLLNVNINTCFNKDTLTLTRNGAGLEFLNGFIKEKLLSVTVAGRGSTTVTERLESIEYIYKVCCKALSLKSGLNLNGIFATAKIFGGQSVSNFRPLASAYLMHRYGVWKYPEKDVLNFWIPSEGWLGRLLSSYYVAYKNPDKQINYISTDPSGDVASSFWDVVDYLKDFGGVSRIKNWNAEIRQHGSDVPEADFFKNEGKKFELIWTSPPYSLGFEIYKESYKIEALDKSNKTVNLKDSHDNYLSEELILDSGQKVKELKSGDKFVYNGEPYTLLKKRTLGQSRNKASTNYGWNEIFFRPSVINARSNLAEGGTMIWNVANVRTHKDLEDDVVRICTEEDFKLIETLKYELSRTPGGIKQEDGTIKNLRDIKPNYEPVFVFERN